MQTITVRFEDLDRTFPDLMDQSEFFTQILRKKYHVKVLTGGTEEPDLLIYSWYGLNNLRWRKCIRIYHTIEQDLPDFNFCDYALGLANIEMPGRFMHFPHYVFYNNLLQRYESLNTHIDEKQVLNRDFCSYVVSNVSRNTNCRPLDIFHQLNKYKQIASGGYWNNNVGGPVKDKLDFIKNYKFNLALENMDVDGYVTEKIMEPFVTRTIPIYWGNRQVKREFGEGGYIDISDFDTVERAIDYIKKVDNDDQLYMEILRHGPQMPHTYNEWCDRLLDFLSQAIENGKIIQDSGLYSVLYNQRYLFYRIYNSPFGRVYRQYQRIKNTFLRYKFKQKNGW